MGPGTLAATGNGLRVGGGIGIRGLWFRGLLLSEGQHTTHTSFLPMTLSISHKTVGLPVNAICCKAVKGREGQQEPVELFPVQVSVL